MNAPHTVTAPPPALAPPGHAPQNQSFRPRPIAGAGSALILAVIAGVTIGVGTQILQGVVPSGLGPLANSGGLWVLGAAAVGACISTDRWAAVAGALALVVASYSYYEAVEWFEHSASSSERARFWALLGVGVGACFGVAGRWITADATRRWIAVGLLAGMLVGEGIHFMRWVGAEDLWPAGLVEASFGGGAALLAFVRSRDRSWTVTAFAVALALTVTALRGMGNIPL